MFVAIYHESHHRDVPAVWPAERAVSDSPLEVRT